MDPISAARSLNATLNGVEDSYSSETADGSRISLPEPETPHADLAETLFRRRSAYAYAEQPLSLAALSSLLRFAVGVQRTVAAYGSTEHPLGMAPSAGGLPTLRTYVIARDAESLPPGVYRHDRVAHDLTEISTGDPSPALTEAYLQPEFVDRAPVTLALTARLDVAFGKYPLRHYRTVHVDTGIAAQNLYLVCTALNLACCAVSGYHDTALGRLLRLGRTEIPMLLFPVGHQRS